MADMLYLKTISDLYRFLNLGHAQHPLIAVVDFGQVIDHAPEEIRIKTDFYSVMFKNYCKNHIQYGRKTLDFQDGSLVCIAPNHMITIDNDIEVKSDMKGWGLFFHPDLIRGSSLGLKMKEYTFFSYEISEALHLSDRENQLLYDCIVKIQSELSQNIDRYSQVLMVSNIELLLNYCSRYYGRQFITRESVHADVVTKVESILKAYFENPEPYPEGIPSVKLLASKVNLSPSYLSDLLKKETGLSAQDHIHYFLIEQAKNVLIQTNQSVSEIAYSLGFEYPQYFSRLFKQKTGHTPLEYRSNN
jgi:AraC-like DNA-binding protein